jgi:NADPH-dependent 2,4-dienoyl-CoA reductase/sulfur reductase-like enzyme/nitrite reductase/ring-hydroxylating ferredoxin subunit
MKLAGSLWPGAAAHGHLHDPDLELTMTAEQTAPTGPDLLVGIPSASLADGSSIAGHVGDDSVLVARAGGRCYAIGATCSHYGGPLAEGIIAGMTVRCPWHHAAFRLDDGVPDRPPALDALPCWRVEESDGRVRVREKVSRATSPPRSVARAHPDSVVIVGVGAAGIAAASTLRRDGYRGRLTMIDADPDAPVDRPNLSKDYLAGTAQEEWVTLRPPTFFSDNELALERRRVTELDVQRKSVRLDDGTGMPYGALLLATGASPIRLPLPTRGNLPMLTLRSLADSRAIIAAASRAGAGGRVVIIGASFIGLEVAASLRARGLEVHVVAPETRPLERVLGPQLGDLIHRVHLDHGVHFHLGQKPRELQDDAVVLESGERITAAFVVTGVGVRPNVDLAERAGLRVDRGIVVDDRLRCSAAGVFAAGDVARYPDARTGEAIRVEHWVAAERQGQTAAHNMLGADERFTAVPFFWSAHYDLSVSYVGHAERWDAIEIDGSLEQRECEVRYVADGRALAVATIGRDRENLVAELAMERETIGTVTAEGR